MKARIFIFLLLSVFYFPTPSLAHPVTYAGGWVFMNTLHPDRNDTHIHYSLNPRLAFGLAYTWLEDENNDDFHFAISRFNFLLKRWNNPGSQGNIYFYGGAGVGWKEGESGFAGLFGAQADYETRRFYTQFNSENLQGEGGNDFQRYSYRIGIAPYLAEFDEIQTFLIAAVSHTPEMDDEWSAGPIVRLFYRDYLAEVGFHGGKFMGTLMYHY